jgi:hypothetical protein
LSREIGPLLRKQQVFRGADVLGIDGRQHRVRRSRKVCSGLARSQTPRMCGKAPCMGTGRSHVCLQRRELQTVLRSRKPNVNDERTWEVGQLQGTGEVAEQSRGTGSGGNGGKGAGQGELARG